MDYITALRCVDACARYLREKNESPLAAKDLLVAVDTIVEHRIKELASKAGSTKSEAKSEASRLNGLKGGRPKKDT